MPAAPLAPLEPARVEELRGTVSNLMPSLTDELAELVKLPSCAFPAYPSEPVLACAEAVADLMSRSGMPSVELLDVPGGYPAVLAEAPAPPGAPTVLLYAHYDVQPPGDLSEWGAGPYEPDVREGRLYGRGAADDKSGVVMHAGAAQALRAGTGGLPVGLKILVEGEEETESHIGPYIVGNVDRVRADVIIVADVGNLRVGEPVLAASLRGHVQLTVEVRSLRAPVHSGMYGGAAPDALAALIRMLSTLHAADGSVAVPGLRSGAWQGAEFPEEALRSAAGVLPGVGLVGSGSIASRLWAQPSVTVLGIDAPTVDHAANVLIPRARAKIGLRIVPGEDPQVAVDAIIAHLTANIPWGVDVSYTPGKLAPGFSAATSGPGYEAAREAMRHAYGQPAGSAGLGGSIPLVDLLNRLMPDAEVILWGAEDFESSKIHAEDESVDLGELERCVLQEALLLESLAPRA